MATVAGVMGPEGTAWPAPFRNRGSAAPAPSAPRPRRTARREIHPKGTSAIPIDLIPARRPWRAQAGRGASTGLGQRQHRPRMRSPSLEKANSDNTSLAQQLDAARASIAALQGQAAATAQVTAQVDPLRSELRLSQDEANRLAIENAQFRTRLALQSPGPGSFRPAP